MVTVTLPDAALLGHPCSFGASTDIRRPYRWQWYRNGKEVPGAPSAAAYQTWPLREEDYAAEYYVKVFGLFGDIEESTPVTLASKFQQPKHITVDPEVGDVMSALGKRYVVVKADRDELVIKPEDGGAVPPPVVSPAVDHAVQPSITPVPPDKQTVPGNDPAKG